MLLLVPLFGFAEAVRAPGVASTLGSFNLSVPPEQQTAYSINSYTIVSHVYLGDTLGNHDVEVLTRALQGGDPAQDIKTKSDNIVLSKQTVTNIKKR